MIGGPWALLLFSSFLANLSLSLFFFPDFPFGCDIVILLLLSLLCHPSLSYLFRFDRAIVGARGCGLAVELWRGLAVGGLVGPSEGVERQLVALGALRGVPVPVPVPVAVAVVER